MNPRLRLPRQLDTITDWKSSHPSEVQGVRHEVPLFTGVKELHFIAKCTRNAFAVHSKACRHNLGKPRVWLRQLGAIWWSILFGACKRIRVYLEKYRYQCCILYLAECSRGQLFLTKKCHWKLGDVTLWLLNPSETSWFQPGDLTYECEHDRMHRCIEYKTNPLTGPTIPLSWESLVEVKPWNPIKFTGTT